MVARKKTAHVSAGEDKGDRGVMMIGVLKLIKGILLTATALGALALLDPRIREKATAWMQLLQDDSQSRYVQAVLNKAAFVDMSTIAKLSVGTFFYAILSLTEGVGLLLRKHWAHYLTVIATASLIPIEIVELSKKFSAPRLMLTAINVAIVVYLIYRLKEKHGTGGRQPESSPSRVVPQV